MFRLLLAITLLTFNLSFAQTKLTLTHESMWAMKRVGTPEISPDGKWVVFTVTEASYDDKENVSDLWLVPSDGSGKARRITSGKSAESGYKWSPDGSQIVFSAKREGDEVSQLYLLNIKDGGDAQRLTNISTGAAAPSWSPDGKMIAFTSRVYPGAFADSSSKKIAEEKKKIKYKARVYTTFPIRFWDQWLDEKQTHAFVVSTETGSWPKDVFSNVSFLTKEGFNLPGSMCWSADSKEIIFAASTDYTSRAYQESHASLFRVSISGGNASKISPDNNDYGNPVMSEDGKYLYCYTSPVNTNKIYDLTKLVRFSWPSMLNKTILAPALDRPINSFALTANTIYLDVEDQGHDKIYSLPLEGGTAQVITSSTVGCYTGMSVSNDGKSMVSNFETASQPAEIVRINASERSHHFLSDYNTEKLKTLDLPAVEEFWFTSSRGKKIKSLLVKPAGFDPSKKYPLFVVMHGGPAGAWKDNWGYRWNYQLLAAPGYVLVMTDYTGSTGYGEKFTQDIQFDPLKGPADEINEAAKEAIKKFTFIDGTKQVCGGGSYGGHLAMWMEASSTQYKCIINHAGMVNGETQWGTSDAIYIREVMYGGPPWMQTKTWKEQNAIRYAEKFKTPMLVTVGENDFRVPINNSLESWSTLQKMKVPSKLIVFPEENHWILKAENSRFWYKEVADWIAKYVK